MNVSTSTGAKKKKKVHKTTVVKAVKKGSKLAASGTKSSTKPLPMPTAAVKKGVKGKKKVAAKVVKGKKKKKKKEEGEEKKAVDKKEADADSDHQKSMAARTAKVKARQTEWEEANEALKMEEKKQLSPDDKGVRHCELELLPEAVQACLAEGFTPLIVDPSERADSFYNYQNQQVIDAKGAFLKVGLHKTISKEEMLEEMRKKLMTAIKAGAILNISMRDGATDFTDTFNDDKTFPTKKVFTPGLLLKEEEYTPLLRDSDKDVNGFFLPKQEFYVIVSSYFEEEDYMDFLKESLPLDQMHAIVVAKEDSTQAGTLKKAKARLGSAKKHF